MSSSGGGIGTTITGGIQDIAAILPLLGTEQCAVQVSSALTQGYLYAAAAPMSIFGSLGVVSAGFKTLIACFSFGDIEGARMLGNMGFEPLGENLSLIMIEAGKGKNRGRYIIESRMDQLIAQLNIDQNRITGVSHKSAAWIVKMMATTALLCAFSVAPYIYLNLGANNLDKRTIWLFPVARATGGFITATLIQLLIQRRITTLSDQYLINRKQPPVPNPDVELAVEPDDMKKRQMDARTWLLLCILFVGLVASIVGYVGCFSVVQNSMSNSGPVSWLCLEAGLSVMRLVIWAYNPTSDDAPPLEINLEPYTDQYEHKPFPTCNKDNEEILRCKVLPLTRARDFLNIITSFVGLIEPFSHPDISLYYTLTQKRPSKESLSGDIESLPGDIENVHRNREENHKLGERILYITVFDHIERTTRVYTQDSDSQMDIFYSTKSDAPLVDVGHFLLEVELDAKIDPKSDPVSSDFNVRDLLREHHRSILERIQYRLGAGDTTKPAYAIENIWTMKAEDTVSVVEMLREEKNREEWKMFVERGKKEERNEESFLISDYFMNSSIERERRLLDEKRVQWIARRMKMIAEETKERFQGKMGLEYRVNMQAVERKPATKSDEEIGQLLFVEQYMMELLLVYEVKEWELLFWNRFKTFLDQIGNDRVEVKERLVREWRADCWKRHSFQMHAAEKRLADWNIDIKKYHLGLLGKWWALTSISQFIEGYENAYSISLSDLREELQTLDEETSRRMENEIEDIQFRLRRGSELGRFDQFWDDDTLFECRYSRSKWIFLPLSGYSSSALEIYSHALKGNKNIIHISFKFGYNFPDSIICDLPWVTSISQYLSGGLPAIHRDALFIKSTNNDLMNFANEVRPKLDSFSTYIFTDAGSFDLYTDKLGNDARVIISFVAPTSDQNLILRLKHSGRKDGPLEVTLGQTTIQLNPVINSSLTIDDITLHPIQVLASDCLSFVPGRNDIVIQFAVKEHGHLLHDVELLDEAALKDPRNQIITRAID